MIDGKNGNNIPPLEGVDLGRRRSTRGSKPDVSPDTPSGDSGGAGGDSGSKSRLADGVRSGPGSSNSSPPNGSQKTSGKDASDDGVAPSSGLSDASNKENKNAGNSTDGKDSKGNSKDKENNGKSKDSGSKENKDDKENKGDSKNKDDKDDNGKKDDADNKDKGDSGKDSKEAGGDSQGSSKKLGDQAKDASSNATGIDYSDKGLKDQLEHQAADAAMDATPGLNAFNSARRALKDFNKAKKNAGRDKEDITDKAEQAMDKGVDAGIKGTKIIAGASIASGAAKLGLMGMLAIQALKMIKGVALAVLGKIAGLFSSIFGAVGSLFSGLLGVGLGIGQGIAIGAAMMFIIGFGTVMYGINQELKKIDEAMADCQPEWTAVSEASQEYLESGDIDAIREDNAVKLWSVYSELGGSKEQTAAVLGNLKYESSLDPTAVETITNEEFIIGERKQAAIQNDFKISAINSSYAADFPAIEYAGIGLAQWTNGRNRLLIEYAEDHDVNWYEFDTQVRFMLDGDESYRQNQLTDFLTDDGGTVDSETERFMNSWIGLSSPNASLSNRQGSAIDFLFVLERATADTDYAESILSGINVNRSQGNNAAAAYHQDDGCGDPILAHYRNQAADGTGEVPSDLTLVPWSRETLPSSLEEFAKNPEDAGLAWGNESGWANGIIADQCAALAHSYFMQLYPDWNKNGRGTTRPFGDGGVLAELWANHYGEQTVSYPTAGAVFSDATTSVYGHAGIVQHVFANGDILINEQNIRGVSGRNGGMSYSWSWRVITKDRYEDNNWEFFKPIDAEPRWVQERL